MFLYACEYNKVGHATLSPKRCSKSIQEKNPTATDDVVCWINNINRLPVILFSSRAFTLSLSIKTERTNKTIKNHVKDTLVCRRTKGELRLIKIHSALWMCVMTRLNSSVLGYFLLSFDFSFLSLQSMLVQHFWSDVTFYSSFSCFWFFFFLCFFALLLGRKKIPFWRAHSHAIVPAEKRRAAL